jgi:hypothetical protein
VETLKQKVMKTETLVIAKQIETEYLKSETFKNLDVDTSTYISTLQAERLFYYLEVEKLKHKVEKLQDLIDKNIGKMF